MLLLCRMAWWVVVLSIAVGVQLEDVGSHHKMPRLGVMDRWCQTGSFHRLYEQCLRLFLNSAHVEVPLIRRSPTHRVIRKFPWWQGRWSRIPRLLGL